MKTLDSIGNEAVLQIKGSTLESDEVHCRGKPRPN